MTHGDPAPKRVAAVVLGAGLGRRLGRGPKAWVRVDGEALVARAARVLREAGVERVVAVLPSGPDPEPLPEQVVAARNPDPASGPLASARLGLAEAGPVDVLVLYPVDHPGVTAADVRAVLRGAAAAGPSVARVVPRWEGRSGHPIAVLGPGLDALRAATDPAATTLRDVLWAAGPATRVAATGPGVLRNVNEVRDL